MGDGAKRWRRTANGAEPLDERMQKICQRLREGLSYKTIASEFGITIQRVGQIRIYAGIERRQRPRASLTGSRLPNTGTA